MKLKATVGERDCDITIENVGGKAIAVIDGVKAEVEVSKPEANVYLLKSQNGVFEVFVEENDATGELNVTVGTDQFEVAIFDPKRLSGANRKRDSEDGVAEIRAAMPGKIVKVMVKAGDEVSEGDGVEVIEAMKMQNELKAPKNGIVREIEVGEEDRVNSGDLLLVIE